MTDFDLDDLLTRWAAGELTEAEFAALEAHLIADPEARRRLRQHAMLDEVLRELPMPKEVKHSGSVPVVLVDTAGDDSVNDGLSSMPDSTMPTSAFSVIRFPGVGLWSGMLTIAVLVAVGRWHVDRYAWAGRRSQQSNSQGRRGEGDDGCTLERRCRSRRGRLVACGLCPSPQRPGGNPIYFGRQSCA
jgi:hypothetical protein